MPALALSLWTFIFCFLQCGAIRLLRKDCAFLKVVIEAKFKYFRFHPLEFLRSRELAREKDLLVTHDISS